MGAFRWMPLAMVTALLSAACTRSLPPVPQHLRTAAELVAEPFGSPPGDGEHPDRYGTVTLVGDGWGLTARHLLDGVNPALFIGYSRPVAGAVVARGEGQVPDTPDTFAFSLQQVMESSEGDWQLIRLAQSSTSGPARWPVRDHAVKVGDRVLLAGYPLRTSGTSADISSHRAWMFTPSLWCRVGVVTEVSAGGAFALRGAGIGPGGGGASGGPAILLDDAGEPQAIVGIFVSDYTGPAFPEVAQRWAVCAPITAEVVRIVQGRPAEGP